MNCSSGGDVITDIRTTTSVPGTPLGAAINGKSLTKLSHSDSKGEATRGSRISQSLRHWADISYEVLEAGP